MPPASDEADASTPDRPCGSSISVVLPAYNEELVLGHALRSLREQTRPPDRVIVVADNCTDTTAQIAREHGVGAGIHYWLGLDKEVAWAKAGGNLVMHSSDVASFSRTLKGEIEQLRKSLG